MEMIGAGSDYVAGGQSYFTVATTIQYLDEVKAGERMTVSTQVIKGAGKKMHLFHRLNVGERLAATVETLLLHVDLETRRSSDPAPEVAKALADHAAAHKRLDQPATDLKS